MKFGIIPVTPYQQNCTVLWCEETGKAAVVDPGGDLDRIQAAIKQQGLSLQKILVTHGHMDHVGAVKALHDQTGLPIEGPHEGDRFWIEGLREYCEMAGFPPSDSFEPDRWLKDGDIVTVGNERLLVRHCPGHTPGHIIFFHEPSKLAIVGDVLFQGSIGRTDFPGGDYDTLINSITQRLWPLGDDVAFIPGHGPMSTFGQERASNPFVADKQFG